MFISNQKVKGSGWIFWRWFYNSGSIRYKNKIIRDNLKNLSSNDETGQKTWPVSNKSFLIMMKLIHITDTHFVPPGKTLFGGDPLKNLERCVATSTSTIPMQKYVFLQEI